MKKLMLFILISILSFTMGCGEKQSYPEENIIEQSWLEGTIDVIDNNNITMLVKKNNSKIQETDKVWLTPGQSVEFDAFKKGQRIRAWVSDEYIRLTSTPQVIATKIEILS